MTDLTSPDDPSDKLTYFLEALKQFDQDGRPRPKRASPQPGQWGEVLAFRPRQTVVSAPDPQAFDAGGELAP